LPDSRGSAAIGREARLELAFERRAGRTVLAHAYAEPPFRITPAFAIGDAAYFIVTSAAPGVFGGDSLHVDVRVGRGARAVLTSQAALQVHPAAALKGPPYDCDDGRSAGLSPRSPQRGSRVAAGDPRSAAIDQRFVLEDDAELHCHWDPTIPFAGSSLEQRIAIDLCASSRLYWSDAFLAGRVDRGEAWRFRALAHELAVRVDGSLTYLERYRLEPGTLHAIEKDGCDEDPSLRWKAGDATRFGTTIVHHPGVSAEAVERIHCTFLRASSIVAAVDRLEPHTMVARLMAFDGAALAATRRELRLVALDTIFHAPELVGRK
jgi:urease accessory protein UreH